MRAVRGEPRVPSKAVVHALRGRPAGTRYSRRMFSRRVVDRCGAAPFVDRSARLALGGPGRTRSSESIFVADGRDVRPQLAALFVSDRRRRPRPLDRRLGNSNADAAKRRYLARRPHLHLPSASRCRVARRRTVHGARRHRVMARRDGPAPQYAASRGLRSRRLDRGAGPVYGRRALGSPLPAVRYTVLCAASRGRQADSSGARIGSRGRLQYRAA